MPQNLLLLHGALGSKKQLESLKEILSEAFNVYSLNFEGHGSVESNREFSIELFTDNVLQFIKNKGIDQTDIFGYNMGGYVAFNLAKNHPAFVRRIISFGTKFSWTKEFSQSEVKKLDPDKIVEKIPAFANHLKAIHFSNWKEVLSKTGRMMLEMGNEKKLNDEDLTRIGHEVMITVGDNDHMVSIEESKKTSQLFPNGTFKIMEGFIHPIEKMNVKEMATVIHDFLKLEYLS